LTFTVVVSDCSFVLLVITDTMQSDKFAPLWHCGQSVLLHLRRGMRDKASVFPCNDPLRWVLSKSNVSNAEIHLATIPSGSLHVFSHVKEEWSVRNIKWRP
jgi:hypothetical protein